ncbi:hypothetical protein SAMN05192554_11936 [Haloarchaeobius iranensis]|uniref:Uncharacterized protein n=1 Tax=Haloarchaeobius iranensis TaxID=996166 RepID=A0A1G9ZBE8_9EURY|nr:hypothetical protein SAMN05192554_11936 [Haloarchaeobius iranensis]
MSVAHHGAVSAANSGATCDGRFTATEPLAAVLSAAQPLP